jgi:hypothetical protein
MHNWPSGVCEADGPAEFKAGDCPPLASA